MVTIIYMDVKLDEWITKGQTRFLIFYSFFNHEYTHQVTRRNILFVLLVWSIVIMATLSNCNSFHLMGTCLFTIHFCENTFPTSIQNLVNCDISLVLKRLSQIRRGCCALMKNCSLTSGCLTQHCCLLSFGHMANGVWRPPKTQEQIIIFDLFKKLCSLTEWTTQYT